MKKLFIVFLIILAGTAFAEQRAITNTGEEVILNSDGTWKYANEKTKSLNKITENTKTFIKPATSSFMLKSTKNNSAFWLNTSRWTFNKAKNNASAEYEFKLKGKDLYGMAITEEIKIPMTSLVDIAYTNAKNFAPNMKIIKKEYRTVNGNKLICMEMQGSTQGIKFSYLGYYYSDDKGSTQYVLYTATDLINKYRPEMLNFLNGLVTQ